MKHKYLLQTKTPNDPRPSFQTFKVTSGWHRLELHTGYKMNSNSLSLSETIHFKYKLFVISFSYYVRKCLSVRFFFLMIGFSLINNALHSIICISIYVQIKCLYLHMYLRMLVCVCALRSQKSTLRAVFNQTSPYLLTFLFVF